MPHPPLRRIQNRGRERLWAGFRHLCDCDGSFHAGMVEVWNHGCWYRIAARQRSANRQHVVDGYAMGLLRTKLNLSRLSAKRLEPNLYSVDCIRQAPNVC